MHKAFKAIIKLYNEPQSRSDKSNSCKLALINRARSSTQNKSSWPLELLKSPDRSAFVERQIAAHTSSETHFRDDDIVGEFFRNNSKGKELHKKKFYSRLTHIHTLRSSGSLLLLFLFSICVHVLLETLSNF